MDAMVQRRAAAGFAEMKHAVVIVGGGASGVTVAAELKRHNPGLDIAIVEPSELHWYQPGWTLVGAGVFRFDLNGEARTARTKQSSPIIPPA
jgi:sulfide:quinone oxidoreductase